jgi:Mrp family chromosome partitioning ATPase
MIADLPIEQRQLPRPADGWPRYLTVENAKQLLFKLRRGHESGVIVQMVAACAGEGTSSLCRDLAWVAATMGLRVLLLDLGTPRGCQLAADHAGVGPRASPVAAIKMMNGALSVYQASASGLHIAEPDRPVDLLPASAWNDVFQTLRGEFDLVLVDSAALSDAYDSLTRAALADTNLLVVQAEQTRIAVVQNLQNRITDAGGAIGGVLLNRRRFHVPGFIYRAV